MKRNLIAVAVVGSVMLSGCATILSDSQYPVSIQSAPSDASFEITDAHGAIVHKGTTPSTVTLNAGAGYFKSANYTLAFKKPGFEDKMVELRPTMDGWFIGNILFGGLIGMLIVDPASGAMWKLPPSISASMDSGATAHKSLQILDVNELPAQVRNELVPLTAN